MFRDVGDCLGSVGGAIDFESLAPDDRAEQLADRLIVIGNEHSRSLFC